MATHSNVRAWRIPVDRGVWWAIVHGASKSWMRLSTTTKHFIFPPREGWSFAPLSLPITSPPKATHSLSFQRTFSLSSWPLEAR